MEVIPGFRLKIRKRLILTISTGLLFALSSLYGTSQTYTLDTATAQTLEAQVQTVNIVEVPVVHIEADEPLTLEGYVRESFKDTPVLIEVARCESRFRQYEKDGKVLRGKVIPQDVGLMQVNERYHLDESKKLGYDIYTVDGNIAYAKWLYKKQGTQPWSASKPCWGNTHIARAN